MLVDDDDDDGEEEEHTAVIVRRKIFGRRDEVVGNWLLYATHSSILCLCKGRYGVQAKEWSMCGSDTVEDVLRRFSLYLNLLSLRLACALLRILIDSLHMGVFLSMFDVTYGISTKNVIRRMSHEVSDDGNRAGTWNGCERLYG